MLGLTIWFVWLINLFILCGLMTSKILLSPHMVFVCSFFPQALFSFYFIKKWRIDLSLKTLSILFLGTGLFVLLSILFQYLFSKIRLVTKYTATNNKNDVEGNDVSQSIIVEKWKLEVFLIFQIAALLLFIGFLQSNVPGRTIFNKIATFNLTNKLEDIQNSISVPRWINWPRMICLSSSYITGYMLIHSIIMQYNNHTILLAMNVFGGVLNSIITGGRMESIGLIVALVVQAYIIWGVNNKWEKTIKIRSWAKVMALGCLILVTFQISVSFLGRKTDLSFINYLGVYIAAPLKNLDTFVRDGSFGNRLANCETLMPLINYIGRTFNMPELIHQRDLPFQWVNSYRLGNVYTAFYCYLHDGGYYGLIGFIALEAFLSQMFCQKAIRPRKGINLSIVIYSYMVYTIFLSFFSDRFFNSIISTTMFRTILCWWLLKFFFTRLRFMRKKSTQL